ncbi:MAG: response regulator [Anaerolineae bacterium]|nr:response regulator [Anaerolineae bacterium]
MQETTSNEKPLALIIEDDPQLVMIFATAMEVAGYEAVTAVDGRIALDKLAVLTPDIILLDVHLPLISGDDLLRHIRADDRLKDTRVILSTADSRIAAQLREEASLVLLKPVSFKELVELATSLT